MVEEKMFCSILGTVVEVKQMSAKAKLLRKTYMGVWRRDRDNQDNDDRVARNVDGIHEQKKETERDLLFLVVEMPKRTKWDTLVQVVLSSVH